MANLTTWQRWNGTGIWSRQGREHALRSIVEYEDHGEQARIIARQMTKQAVDVRASHGMHEGKTPVAQELYTTRGDWDWEGKNVYRGFFGHNTWYVIGWGEENGPEGINKWLVCWHEGFSDWVDVLSGSRRRLRPETVSGIRTAMSGLGIKRMEKEVGKLFPVLIDDARGELSVQV